MKKYLFIRLALMMFMQYMLFAIWWVPFAAYLANINITGARNAMLLSTMAIGCLASPLLGMLADRYFPANRLLLVINLVNGILLIIAGRLTDNNLLLAVLIFSMLLYMPTWALTNAISMTHIDSEKFPRIRVFGSIGWVTAGVFSLISVKLLNTGFDGTNIPFYYAGAASMLAGVLNLTLPMTPAPGKGTKGNIADAFGLRTLRFMTDKNFAAFIILSFLSVMPFSMYWSYCSEFLFDRGFEFITVTMNTGQIAEMLIMLSVPLMLSKFGLRKTMTLGMLAMGIRYAAFYLGVKIDASMTYFIGILVHGFIIGYFYTAGQIYVDKKMPAELKAQGQGFIFLVTWGVGLLISNFIARKIIDNYSDIYENVKVYDWTSIWGITTIISVILIVAFIIFFRNTREGNTETSKSKS